MYKLEILKQTIELMLRSKLMKGFRSWKHFTLIDKEQKKYNKLKGSEQIIA